MDFTIQVIQHTLGFFLNLFNTEGFPSRWHCGANWQGWGEPHGWLHIVSDLGVWSAYVAIPLVLGYFILRRRDLPFRKIFLLFGAFILACGTTHLMEAIIFWWPAYRLAGVIKLFTALVSWSTVLALIPIVPRVLSMRTPEELEREIAAREEAEEQLHHANVELERRVEERTQQIQGLMVELQEADRRKDEFLATLAHELRNPLAPLRNSLEVMKHARGNPEITEEARSTMERQLGQMVWLVDDLLDISRITRNKVQLRRERVELASILHRAVEMCEPLLKKLDHHLVLHLPPEPVYLDADPVRLAQVFSNVLNNACKFTPRQGRIEISAQREGNEVVVSVKDTGIGIPAEMLTKVFDMFTQVDPSLEKSHGGLGIGLTLVARLVEMHGGTVTARSAGKGEGSEFVVRLPALAESHAAIIPPAPAGPILGQPSRRILVVDDNRDAATALSMLLQLHGHEIEQAHDGQEAIERAEAYRPQVILLDIGLPKRNGYDVCRSIRQQAWSAGVTIIALTGWGQDNDRRKSSEAGFDGHLVKPVSYDMLGGFLKEPSSK